MRITGSLVHRVNLPLLTGYYWASGVYFGATKAIVEVPSDEGIVGLGEVSKVAYADIVEREFPPRLKGVDSFNIDDSCRLGLPEIRTPSRIRRTGFAPVPARATLGRAGHRGWPCRGDGWRHGPGCSFLVQTALLYANETSLI
jgi:L-alanine-DL-glutamate epimerase-like enolase superfamily enzyme